MSNTDCYNLISRIIGLKELVINVKNKNVNINIDVLLDDIIIYCDIIYDHICEINNILNE